MPDRTYSIAEARDRFAAVVHEAEATQRPVHLTRRGKRVAVVLALDAYERLRQRDPNTTLAEALAGYHARWQDVPMDVDEEVWHDVRV